MNIRELAAAVTLQAAQDYYNDKCSLAELEYYINYSPFFQILDIDGEKALRACILKKAEQNEKKTHKKTDDSCGQSCGNMDNATAAGIHPEKDKGKRRQNKKI